MSTNRSRSLAYPPDGTGHRASVSCMVGNSRTPPSASRPVSLVQQVNLDSTSPALGFPELDKSHLPRRRSPADRRLGAHTQSEFSSDQLANSLTPRRSRPLGGCVSRRTSRQGASSGSRSRNPFRAAGAVEHDVAPVAGDRRRYAGQKPEQEPDAA